jgi:hypothetical protein
MLIIWILVSMCGVVVVTVYLSAVHLIYCDHGLWWALVFIISTAIFICVMIWLSLQIMSTYSITINVNRIE